MVVVPLVAPPEERPTGAIREVSDTEVACTATPFAGSQK